MRLSRSERSIKAILKAEPECAIIKTPAGNWKIYRYQFGELMTLEPFVQVADRVGRVRDDFRVVIERNGFTAVRRFPARPSAPMGTFAQLIEAHAIKSHKGPNLTPQQREREVSREYEMRMTFAPCD